jgi:hypothetical protein
MSPEEYKAWMKKYAVKDDEQEASVKTTP